MNRSWPDRRFHRERIINRRVRQYQDLDGGWTLPEHVGRLDKSHSETLAVWCDHDWTTNSRGDSIRRNHIIKGILDAEQRRAVEESA